MSAVLEQSIPTRVYRDYSLEFKAEAIALYKSNNNNCLQTANELGIDESLLRLWLSKADAYRTLSEKKQADLADIAEANARRLADSIYNQDLSETPLNHKATAFGIMVDKMQLLRNLPTSIVESSHRVDVSVFLDDSLSDVIDVTPE